MDNHLCGNVGVEIWSNKQAIRVCVTNISIAPPPNSLPEYMLAHCTRPPLTSPSDDFLPIPRVRQVFVTPRTRASIYLRGVGWTGHTGIG